jgi:hypothetical protein
MMIRLFSLVALAGLLVVPKSFAQDTKAGAKLVEHNQKFIMNVAYPTNKRLDSIRQVDSKVGAGGFSLDYEFKYTDSDGDPAKVTFRFQFQRNGTLDAIQTVYTSSFWPPFSTVKLLAEVLREACKNDDKYRTDKTYKAIVDSADAGALIILTINANRP